ncbi:MAG TPA: GDP-mannose 4,6-dehydratase [Acidimicrobiales bacterium]|nr:GDP-mannose 4,6-dehydratase [Acidimicrobiales bacterium]
MRAFITGASGFVGGWLSAHLKEMGDEVATLPDEIDIALPGVCEHLITEAEPEVIYHLAALTHVGRSWEEPSETFRVNVLGTIELLEAVRKLDLVPRVVLISSAEVYGAGDGSVIDENSLFMPVTPYAASKVATEICGLQAFLGREIGVVRARPFNHIGPGQAEFFVVSALAKRIVEAEMSGEHAIRVGNLSAERDFTDVRDVVRAYRELAISGVPGEAYNVCSGYTRSVQEIFDALRERSVVPIEARVDETLFRPVDVERIVGSAKKLESLTGWRPQIDLEKTVDDVLDAWRRRLDPS